MNHETVTSSHTTSQIQLATAPEISSVAGALPSIFQQMTTTTEGNNNGEQKEPVKSAFEVVIPSSVLPISSTFNNKKEIYSPSKGTAPTPDLCYHCPNCGVQLGNREEAIPVSIGTIVRYAMRQERGKKQQLIRRIESDYGCSSPDGRKNEFLPGSEQILLRDSSWFAALPPILRSLKYGPEDLFERFQTCSKEVRLCDSCRRIFCDTAELDRIAKKVSRQGKGRDSKKQRAVNQFHYLGAQRDTDRGIDMAFTTYQTRQRNAERSLQDKRELRVLAQQVAGNRLDSSLLPTRNDEKQQIDWIVSVGLANHHANVTLPSVGSRHALLLPGGTNAESNVAGKINEERRHSLIVYDGSPKQQQRGPKQSVPPQTTSVSTVFAGAELEDNPLILNLESLARNPYFADVLGAVDGSPSAVNYRNCVFSESDANDDGDVLHASTMPLRKNTKRRKKQEAGSVESLIIKSATLVLGPHDITSYDVTPSQRLTFELWSALCKVCEFGELNEPSLSMVSEDVPARHDFFTIYRKNSLRLPLPPHPQIRFPKPVSHWDPLHIFERNVVAGRGHKKTNDTVGTQQQGKGTYQLTEKQVSEAARHTATSMFGVMSPHSILQSEGLEPAEIDLLRHVLEDEKNDPHDERNDPLPLESDFDSNDGMESDGSDISNN